MNASLATPETPTRTRTRNAILDAAIHVLVENGGASLGEIADAASVARSTLHRYFPERSDLLEAMKVFADGQIADATARARLGEGTASEALLRLGHEYFDLRDTFMWSYPDSLKSEAEACEGGESLDPVLSAVIVRGYAEGTIDPSLPDAWIQQMLWALLYSAWEYVRQGESKHRALELTLRSLRKVVAPGVAGPA